MKYILESLNNAGTENYIYQILKQNKFDEPVDLIVFGAVDVGFLCKIKPFIRGIQEFPADEKVNKYKWLYSLIKNDDAKIIHCHLYASLLPSLLVINLLKVKVIVTLHMPLSKWGVKIKINWLLSLVFADQLITVSTAVKNELVKFKKNIIVCYAPVESSSKKHSDAKNDIFEITGVGRLSKEKDWPTLIKAIHILKQEKTYNIKLTICGGGPDEVMLREMVDTLHLSETVTLTGHLEKSLIEDRLSQSDLFVLPSKFEGFGIAPVEAMQMGLPTITANYPASQDYITHDVTGWTFPIGDSQALATLIRQLINHPEHTQQIAKAGQILVRDKFSPEKIAQQHIALYREINH